MERPKPPRTAPPSEPTMRSRAPSDPSMRAAGLTRPQSSPEMRATANAALADFELGPQGRAELERQGRQLRSHDGRIAQNEAATKASAQHTRRLERKIDAICSAVGVENDEIEGDDEAAQGTTGDSDPPPADDSGKSLERHTERRKKKRSNVASDSAVTKYIGYATFLGVLAKALWDAFHGGK